MAISKLNGNSNGKSKRRQDNLLLETSFTLTVAHHLMVSSLGRFANSSRRKITCKVLLLNIFILNFSMIVGGIDNENRSRDNLKLLTP